MKIGVWLNSQYNKQSGGGYSYYKTFVNAIDNFN